MPIMGHESLIDWISPEIALAYFVATTVALIGVLQIAGARWDRLELRWPRSRSAAVLLGLVLVLASAAAFYVGMERLIFVPGLAGAELMVLFAAATLLATIVVRLIAWLLHRRAPAPTPSPPASQRIEAGPGWVVAAPPGPGTDAGSVGDSERSRGASNADSRSLKDAEPERRGLGTPLPDDAAWVAPRPTSDGRTEPDEEQRTS